MSKRRRRRDAETLVAEIPKGRRVDGEARQQLADGISRRELLRKVTLIGALGGLTGASMLSGYGFGVAQGAPGAGASGTTITDEDIDAKRIAGVRIATEFITGTVPAGTDADPYPGSAIQAAIDDLPSTGGTVFVPAGTWLLSSPITVGTKTTMIDLGSKPVALVGAGMYATTIKLADDSVRMDSLIIIGRANATDSAFVSGTSFSDMTFNFNGTNQTATYTPPNDGWILAFGDAERCKVERCRFLDSKGQAIEVVGQSRYNDFGPCIFDSCWSSVFFSSAACQRNVLRDSFVIDAGQHGGWLGEDFASFNKFSNVWVISATGVGIQDQGSDDTVENCVVISSGQSGITLEGARGQCVGSRVESAGTVGILVKGPADEFLIESCSIQSSQTHGIATETGANNGRIEGCEIKNSSQSGATIDDGIRIDGCNGIVIIGNKIFDDQGTKTQDYGIKSINASDDLTILGNDVRNNLSGGISLAGTNNWIYGNKGFNPQGVATITVTASPFTYTNNDNVPEAIYITGGTVSDISKDGTTLFTVSPAMVWLEPGESVVVTYSAAPTMNKDRK